MLWASPEQGNLEMRRGGDGSRVVTGRFPYGSKATLHAGGNGQKPRKEQFASRAFDYVVNGEGRDRDVSFLVGHSFDKPLASRSAGSFQLFDGDDALTFEAKITPEMQETTWGADFLRSFNAGLMVGISPGFRVAPRDVVAVPESVTEEDPKEGKALIRTIFHAILFEMSMVTRAAYPDTEALVESRSWDQTTGGVITPKRREYRWR